MSDCYCFSAPVKGCPTHDNEHGPFPDLGSGPTASERSWIYGSAQWSTDPLDEIATVVKALKKSFDQCKEEEAQKILDLPKPDPLNYPWIGSLEVDKTIQINRDEMAEASYRSEDVEEEEKS